MKKTDFLCRYLPSSGLHQHSGEMENFKRRRLDIEDQDPVIIIDESFIPEDLITETLLRTPASSVLRFKTVCKQWCSIIKDPFFCVHFDHLRKNPTVSFAVLCYDDDGRRLITFEDEEELKLELNGVADGKQTVMIPETKSEQFDGIRMVVCNGLLCFYFHHIHICNPTTREFVTLPVKAAFKSVAFGFGYDPGNRQYKAVQLLPQCYRAQNSPMDVILNVYTLGDGSKSWRTALLTADDTEFPNFSGSASCYIGRHVDCSIYWLVTNHWCKIYIGVLGFDVRDETFRFIKLPDDYSYTFVDDNTRSTMFEMKERRLGIVKHDHEQHIIDVWMLKEDSTQYLWTKEYKLDVRSIDDENPYSYAIPVRILSGKILFMTTKGLVSYDLQSNNIEQVSESSNRKFDVDVYMQTMLSLHDMAW